MTSHLPDLLRHAPLGIPLLCLAAALAPLGATPFSRASAASAAMLVLAVLGAVGIALTAPGVPPETLGGLARLDGVGATVLLLVAFITAVIVRYARSYLGADPGALRHARWLMVTVASVNVLVLSNHLLLLVLAWAATGLALHPLLTHFEERPAALVAAHKKFLVSRLADACLLVALGLLHHHAQTLRVDQLTAWATQAAQSGPLPWGAQLAAVLLVAGVCLKSAQLPFHGWLIQVMEAPTPVSALLHAGVVNMGGLVMIRLAALMAHFPAAQFLLVAVGTTTAVLAALVMTTRVSIKVALAWSTCAQMGFMLLQCGLGAYHLALLHLVAHSLYKAHAFLASGTTVDTWRTLDLLPTQTRSPLTRWAAAAVLGGAVAALAMGFPLPGTADSSLHALWTLGLGLALVPAWLDAFQRGWRGVPRALLASGAVALLTRGWHVAAAALFPSLTAFTEPSGGAALVALGTLVLFATNAALQAQPNAPWSQRMYQRLFAGLHLDERFTRLTFQVWPPRLPAPRPTPALTIQPNANEA